MIHNRYETLQESFERQVAATPNNIALVDGHLKLSYQLLNARANQLAHHLQGKYALEPEDIVALHLNYSAKTIITILAVLKCGAAYLALNPESPEKRILEILASTSSKIIIINQEYHEKISNLKKITDPAAKFPAIEIIDAENSELSLAAKPKTNPKPSSHGSNLAYILYTSGTTKSPKGIMVEQHSLVSKINYLIHQHAINSNYVIAGKTPYVFDPSLREIFLALLSGAKLILIPDYRNLSTITELIAKYRINLLIFVPSQLSLFINSLTNPVLESYKLDSLQLIYSCGETLTTHTAKQLFKRFPNITLANQYGPSECCMFSCQYILNREKLARISALTIPIGSAIENSKIYLLNQDRQPVNAGETGEIYIASPDLARGYLNNPELTQKTFIAPPNKLARNYAQRLYKTGDLARHLDDGNLEYIGRSDFQIKIRGQRVELGEIEDKLLTYPSISQAVTLAVTYQSEDGGGTDGLEDKYLTAFYVANNEINPQKLHEYLKKHLLDYMLPANYFQLEQLPLTVNGKLDRQALLKLTVKPLQQAYDYSGYSANEAYLAKLWQEMLPNWQQPIQLTDNFFALGGHSLLVGKLIQRVYQQHQLILSATQIYSTKNLREQALLLTLPKNATTLLAKEASEVQRYPEGKSEYPLNNYQQSIYFAHLMNKAAYTMPVFIRSKERLAIQRAKKAFSQLVHKHKILSGAIEERPNGLFHIISGKAQVKISKLAENKLAEYLQQLANYSFKLNKELTNFQIIQVTAPDEEYTILSFTHHHLIGDAYSTNLILNDYCGFYQDRGDTKTLPSYHYKEVADYVAAKNKTPEFKQKILAQMLPTNPQFSLNPLNNLASTCPSGLGRVINQFTLEKLF